MSVLTGEYFVPQIAQITRMEVRKRTVEDEQGLINDGRLLITDFVHTENTEGNGGPQADGFVGKQQLSSIGQQLKEKYFFKLPLYCR